MNLVAGLELSLLAVCLWGLFAVLLTSQFNVIVIIGCMAAIIAGYYLRKRGWKPSPILANIAAVVVFIVCGIIFLSSLNLLVTTVYLFLFLQVTKYLTRQNITEIRWCYLISLFHVIGASVITTAITFGVMLVVYIFLILVSLRLYVMARSHETAQQVDIRRQKKHSAKPSALVPLTSLQLVQHLPRRLVRTSIGLTVFVLLLSSVLFSAIPRLATQNLFQQYGPAPDEPAVSAFSENVEFGSFTAIQQDDAVALFVQPLGRKKPSHVRMRGVALDSFDGRAWRRTNAVRLLSGEYDFRPLFTTHLYDDENNYAFRVLQPPGVTNFLFGDSFPIKIKVPSPFLFLSDPMAQTVYLPEMPPKEFQYEVTSMHEDLAKREDPALTDAVDQPPKALMLPPQSSEEQQGSDDDMSLARWVRHMAQELATTSTWVATSEDINSTDTMAGTGLREEGRELREGRRQRREDGDFWRGSDGGSDERAFSPWRTNDSNGLRGPRRSFSPRERLRFYLDKCLQLPENLSTGRVPELARTWTTDSETTFAKALVIESRLRNDYGYSLTPRATGNFIESFLFDVREGHCEYFATSMAVLLRNLGIPARIVNGYYSTEWNSISGNFTARHRDAHSWVEAWLGDDYGWMTFDPTPPGGVGRRSAQNFLLSNLSSVMDAVRVRWYRYVVDYNISDQMSALNKLMEWRRKMMSYLDRSSILGVKSSKGFEIGDLSAPIDYRPVAVGGVLIAAILLWQLIQMVNRRRNGRLSAIRYYDELLRLLARRGFRLLAGQTPREFARQVAQKKPQWANFVDVTELYYLCRYHGAQPSKQDFELVKLVKKALKDKKSS